MSDDQHARRLAWGLDLSRPEVTTRAEIDEFRRISSLQLDVQQSGLDFWLEENPEVLKRYRAWADTLRVHTPDKKPNSYSGSGITILINYANHGFTTGLKYSIRGTNRFLTKAECLEVFALAFRYVGPKGMALIAEAARQTVWKEPALPALWPEGWGPDSDAFRSGLDFSKPGLSDAEKKLLDDWYLRYLGEVPGHVHLLAKERPEMLKAYRSRFENTLRLLPKQLEPSVLIQTSVERAFPQGIREGVLLARGFGMKKVEVLEAMSWGTFYGTVPALDAAYEAVGDVLDDWVDPVPARV